MLEVSRIHKTFQKQDTFRESVFTIQEIEYCENMQFKEQHYAARFAAKEAFMKAIGTGWRNGIMFTEIGVLNNELGKPEIILEGKAKEIAKNLGVKHIHISISHLKDVASAFVILTK